MIEQYGMIALMLWVLHAMFVAVVGVVGLDLPGALEDPLLTWGWLVAPTVFLAGVAIAMARKTCRFQPGDHIVYNMSKRSPHPTPRAEHVYPTPHGEDYVYIVRKLWTVIRRLDDQRIEALTPGGKRHVVRTDDPHLHKATRWETLKLWCLWNKKFPSLQNASS